MTSIVMRLFEDTGKVRPLAGRFMTGRVLPLTGVHVVRCVRMSVCAVLGGRIVMAGALLVPRNMIVFFWWVSRFFCFVCVLGRIQFCLDVHIVVGNLWFGF